MTGNARDIPSKLSAVTMSLLFMALCLLVQPAFRDIAAAESADENSAASVVLASRSAERKSLEIGFNLSYTDRISAQEGPLRRISRDGFRVVRIFEVFSGRDSDDILDRLVEAIGKVEEKGLIPFLSLSNFPRHLAPDSKRQNELASRLPARVRNQVPKMSRYSNRFPPRDLSDYRLFLEKFKDRLQTSFSVESMANWYFELGNEPDAPRYYWGSPTEFEAVIRTAIQVLKPLNAKIGGFGITSRRSLGLIRDNGYLKMIERTEDDSLLDFVSFHFYVEHSTGDFNDILHALAAQIDNSDSHKFITEWNVATSGRRAIDEMNTDEFMEKLIETVHACYRHDVSMLLVFKLMDYAKQQSLQLGIFGNDGQPKPAYQFLTIMKEVVQDGYRSVSDKRTIAILGPDKLILYAKKGAVPDTVSGYSLAVRGSGKSWAMYRKN